MDLYARQQLRLIFDAYLLIILLDFPAYISVMLILDAVTCLL